MMHLCRLPMLLLVVGWTTVTHFSGVSPNSIFIDYSLSRKVQLELLQIRVNTLGYLRYSGNSIGSLFSFARSSNWLSWCTSLFILVSLNILLHIYPHTTLLTILDVVSQSVANFLNVPKFQPKIHKSSKQFGFSFAFDGLFGIHFLKTFMHYPILPLLERSSKPISMQRHILLSSFSLMASPWC